jgi:predicted O-methyltransferase YrrM
LPIISNLRSRLPLFRRLLAKGREPALEEILAPLDPAYRARLLSMYRGEPQLGLDGLPHPLHPQTKISPGEGLCLFELCVSLKPKCTIEIGMAYGYSTLYILAAMAKNPGGHHTAVDPFQRASWNGIGLAHARALTTESEFRFIEERSDRAAADLGRENAAFDMIFIDGNHRFDDVLADFYLYAPLCRMGGIMILDDMWMDSVRTVASFVRTNRRDFAEVPVSESNISVFRRTTEDARNWDHFQRFVVSDAPGGHR